MPVQQPLYHAALSLVAARDFEFFNRAKLVSLGIGLLALLTCFLVGRRVFGDAPALVGALLMALSHAFVYNATMVACGPLLMVWLLLAWGSVARRDRDGAPGLRSAAYLGLGFLTKASALLLAPVYAVYVLAKAPAKRRRQRTLLWALIFVAVISPVLIRNVVVFGDPLHNPHSNIMWLDRWEDWYRPEFRQSPPTALSYLRSHSLAQTAGRFADGVKGVGGILVTEVLGFFGLPLGLKRLTGLLVLALAVAGLCLDRRASRGLFSLALVVVFGVALSWYYAVSGASRFVMPLAPILQLYAGATFVTACRIAQTKLRADGVSAANAVAASVGVLSLALLLGVNVRLRSLRANPLAVGRVAPGYDELKAWLQERVGPGESYAHGPSHAYKFEWNSDPPLRAAPLPLVNKIKTLEGLLGIRGVRYVLLDYDTVFRRRNLLEGIVERPRRRDGPMRILALPPGWKVATHGPKGGWVYVVLELAPGPPT